MMYGRIRRELCRERWEEKGKKRELKHWYSERERERGSKKMRVEEGWGEMSD